MITLLLLQLILPIGLLAWVLVWPARDALGQGAQLTVLASLVVALAIKGLWLFPPWWSVWVYAAGVVGALLLSLVRRPSRLWPQGALAWVRAALLLILAGYAAREAVLGWSGSRSSFARLGRAPGALGRCRSPSRDDPQIRDAHRSREWPTTARCASGSSIRRHEPRRRLGRTHETSACPSAGAPLFSLGVADHDRIRALAQNLPPYPGLLTGFGKSDVVSGAKAHCPGSSVEHVSEDPRLRARWSDT